MAQQRIGVAVTAADSNAALAAVEDLERRGISAAWMTSGSAGGGDALSVFAAAGTRTRDIMMGTAITQTFPRHPIALAQQVLTLAQFAPGRFRLGLGTSRQGGMEQTIGANFRAPLAHLREYVRILKALLQEGSVDHSGRYYQAHSNIPAPVDVPVMAAALGTRAYEICGAEADGAISWVCPRSYLQDVALPAMQRGAKRADREVPPLVAHVPVCVHDDPEEARQAVAQRSEDSPGRPSTSTCSPPPGSRKCRRVLGVREWWTPWRCGAMSPRFQRGCKGCWRWGPRSLWPLRWPPARIAKRRWSAPWGC